MHTTQRYTLFLAVLAAIGLAAPRSISARQAASSATLTIGQAVENALRNYPSITVSQEQVNAATAAIDLARTAYLPRIDSVAQVNRGTRNNVFGLLFPQSVMPAISGPVLGSNNLGTVWGSAVGALVTWEPFDFGLREASISAATASKARAEAGFKRTLFEVSVIVADTYLTLAAAQETVRAAQAAVDRAELLQRSVRAQVEAQLRPGADASRAEAELAASRTQLAQAQQAVEIAKAVLGQFLGIPPQQILISAPRLFQLPAEEPSRTPDTTQNPLAAEQNAVVDQKKAELHVLEKSYFPRFFAQGSAYARGTGANINGSRLGGFNGLAPDTQNYVLGFGVTFPVFDFASIRVREKGQAATIRAETARYQQVTIDLRAQLNVARATLEGSRKVATNTPVQVSSSNAAVQQATARYQSGLGTIIEVADAQRLLTQAEIDDALARLNVWRALLRVAVASGDIQPFLTGASQ